MSSGITCKSRGDVIWCHLIITCYYQVEDSYVNTSSFGGLVSVLCWIGIVILLYSEVNYFYQPSSSQFVGFVTWNFFSLGNKFLISLTMMLHIETFVSQNIVYIVYSFTEITKNNNLIKIKLISTSQMPKLLLIHMN